VPACVTQLSFLFPFNTQLCGVPVKFLARNGGKFLDLDNFPADVCALAGEFVTCAKCARDFGTFRPVDVQVSSLIYNCMYKACTCTCTYTQWL